MNGNTAVQLRSSKTTEATADGTSTMVAGTKTFERIIRQGKLIAAAHASVVERSSRAPAIQSSSGRSIGKVRKQATTIAIAASAHVMPKSVKNSPVEPS